MKVFRELIPVNNELKNFRKRVLFLTLFHGSNSGIIHSVFKRNRRFYRKYDCSGNMDYISFYINELLYETLFQYGGKRYEKGIFGIFNNCSYVMRM